MNQATATERIEKSGMFVAVVPCDEVDFGGCWGKCTTRSIYFYGTSHEDAKLFLAKLGIGAEPLKCI